MASAPERVDPVFGDALAGDGGMTDPVSVGPRRDTSFDVFPDALSALPMPALTFTVPASQNIGGLAGAGVTGASVRATAPDRAARTTTPRAAAASVPSGPPTGRPWSGFPPPGQPLAVQPPTIATAAPYSRPAALPRQTRPTPMPNSARGVLAPGTGRRPVAGVGYTPPPTSSAGVVRPPAYLPQNSGVAQLRAAVRQARGTRASGSAVRPASPAAVRPAPPTGARRGSNRASSIWALFVFAIIFLVSSGAGQSLIEAISRLVHHR